MLRLRRYTSNIGSKSAISLQRGPVDLKFQVEGDTPTNHSSSQKAKLNDFFSYGIKIWTDLSSVLSQSTRLTDGRTDGPTDGWTEFSSLDRVCIACSAVKMVHFRWRYTSRGLIALNERVIRRARVADKRNMYVLTKSLPTVGCVSTCK